MHTSYFARTFHWHIPPTTPSPRSPRLWEVLRRKRYSFFGELSRAAKERFPTFLDDLSRDPLSFRRSPERFANFLRRFALSDISNFRSLFAVSLHTSHPFRHSCQTSFSFQFANFLVQRSTKICNFFLQTEGLFSACPPCFPYLGNPKLPDRPFLFSSVIFWNCLIVHFSSRTQKKRPEPAFCGFRSLS